MHDGHAKSVKACLQKPNAGAHLLPEAGATQERTLEAVRCSAWLGSGSATGFSAGEVHRFHVVLPLLPPQAALCHASPITRGNVGSAFHSVMEPS